jgi:peroxiredoxin Q/BCP
MNRKRTPRAYKIAGMLAVIPLVVLGNVFAGDPVLLPVGSPAPVFSAVAHDGQKFDLAALKGRYVVLYFYPKDDTSGCTKEACEIRDSWAKLQKLGVAVFGVSTQDNESHRSFAGKYHLPFPLLADDKGEIAARYKVPLTFGMAHRITYLIGKDGKIAHVWPKVNPVGHGAEILAAIPGGSPG